MTAVDTAGVLQQQITDSSAAAVTAIDTAAAVNDVVEVLQKLDSSAVSNDSSVVRCVNNPDVDAIWSTQSDWVMISLLER